MLSFRYCSSLPSQLPLLRQRSTNPTSPQPQSLELVYDLSSVAVNEVFIPGLDATGVIWQPRNAQSSPDPIPSSENTLMPWPSSIALSLIYHICTANPRNPASPLLQRLRSYPLTKPASPLAARSRSRQVEIAGRNGPHRHQSQHDHHSGSGSYHGEIGPVS